MVLFSCVGRVAIPVKEDDDAQCISNTPSSNSEEGQDPRYEDFEIKQDGVRFFTSARSFDLL